MHVRRMMFTDLPEVSAIDQESFSQPWPAEAFEIELDNSNARCWVAETDLGPDSAQKNQIIAILVIWRVLDEAHIATIAVKQSFRRQGVGKLILIKGMQDAYREGARIFHLEVRAGNLAAQEMYFHLGYQVVGKRPRYYKNNGEDALLMTLDLTSQQQADFFTGDAP